MPFYIKNDDGNWARFSSPTDIRNDKGRLLASVYPGQEDLDQLRIFIPKDVAAIAISERRDVVFPGQEGLINRDDVVIFDTSQGGNLIVVAVIHSNEPIEG